MEQLPEVVPRPLHNSDELRLHVSVVHSRVLMTEPENVTDAEHSPPEHEREAAVTPMS